MDLMFATNVATVHLHFPRNPVTNFMDIDELVDLFGSYVIVGKDAQHNFWDIS